MNLWKALLCAAAVLALLCCPDVTKAEPPQPAHTVPVLMLSDFHFDPFRDPAKAAELRQEKASRWARILEEPASPHQAADYEALQTTCHARGMDSSWGLMRSTLLAAHDQDPKPLFILVSGDLLTHNFDCRLRTLLPSATPQELSQFAAKTVEFVALEMRKTFPGVPVYLALGNNDSGCANYRQSTGSAFLRSAARSMEKDIANNRGSAALLDEVFDSEADYMVKLPTPLHRTHLIVLQDIFESAGFQNCQAKADPRPAAAQIAWLKGELAHARKHKQHVWVMAHIPPGVDAYASFHKFVSSPEKMCSVTHPVPMLGSEALSDTLADYADVVRLAVFAHTHMDEMKLLHNASGGQVAVKLVPSVSPVNGNLPSFLLAQVNPHTATLFDYAVFTAKDGNGGEFPLAYRYSEAYKMPDYSPGSVASLTAKFAADKTGDGPESKTYARWFFPGDSGEFAEGLHKIWPSYACGTAEDGGTAYRGCMCPADTSGGAETTSAKP